MRQEHRVRILRLDTRGAPRPELDVDIGRRGGRAHVIALDADAGDIADKRDAARAIEEADVMRGVARRIRHIERPAARMNRLQIQRDHVRRRNGCHLAPQRLHLIAP